jgi:hypothetical protein
MMTGNPLPKVDKSCAATPRQFGWVSPKIIANPFHKVNLSYFLTNQLKI